MMTLGIFGLIFLLGLLLALAWLLAHGAGGPVSAAPPQGPATAAACPECEAVLPADSPEGLCPRCLLGPAFASPSSGAVGQTVSPPEYGAFTAPAPGELAPHFPQLEVLELRGQGGMGAVYRARQVKLDRLVALKVLPAEWGRDPAFAERFAREARALARLNHPHIVAVHDFGEAGGHFYLLMEFVDGVNLRQPLLSGPVDPALALRIIPQVCDALQYAHEEGVVHRDIKPENILLDRRGRVKIADFGLAKLVGSSRASFTLTGTHQVMGTLDYMAPEQRQRPQEVDHRADIYALGVVFYELLTGELPLGRFAPPSRVAAVDDRLDEVIFRALEREPEQRYQRASDVRGDLDSIHGGHPAGTYGPAASPTDESERVQLLVKGPAAVLLMAAVLAVLYWAGFGVVGIVNYALDSVMRRDIPPWGAVGILLGGATVVLALAGTLVTGALRLRRFEGYEWVVVALALAMLPWSIHWPLGVVAGLWGLWALGRPEVRAAFAANLRRGQRSAPTPARPRNREEHRPTGPVGRRVRSFLRSFRSLFFSTPDAPPT